LRLFIIPECYHSILTEIKTPTNRESKSLQLKYLYPIHRLIHEKVHSKDSYDKNGFRLSTKVLAELFGSGKIAKQVISYLLKRKYLVKIKEHVINVESSSYKLHESIADLKFYTQDFNACDSAMILKLEERQELGKIELYQQKTLFNYVYVNSSGVNYLLSKYPELISSEEIAVEAVDWPLYQIYLRRFYVKRPDPKSRLYHNLTQLKREHRRYIFFDGSEMYMTDIKNCQILMSVPIIVSHYKMLIGKSIAELPEDLKKFKHLCEKGEVYDYLMNKMLIKVDRNRFKELFFMQVYYCQNNSWKNQNIKELFKQEFPTVFKIITQLKEKDYKSFSIKLQRFESSVLIDKVYKQLSKKGINCLTLHDSIICSQEQDLSLAESLITKEMLKWNICPAFKRENGNLNEINLAS
jgi:hypothetical protein